MLQNYSLQTDLLINLAADLMSTKALLNASVSRGVLELKKLCLCVGEFNERVRKFDEGFRCVCCIVCFVQFKHSLKSIFIKAENKKKK